MAFLRRSLTSCWLQTFFPALCMARNSSATAHAVSRSWTWLKDVGGDIFSVGPQGLRAPQFCMSLPSQDSLRVATGRSLSLFGRLHTLSSGGRSPIPASVFALFQRIPGTWARWCFSLLHHHAAGSPGSHGVGVGCSALVVRRWLRRVVFPVLDRAWVQRLARALAIITGVRFSPGILRPYALDLSIYSSNIDPGLVRWWGLARHGHDPCPGGRPARHRGGEVACFCCPSTLGDLTHCLTSCPAFEDLRMQW